MEKIVLVLSGPSGVGKGTLVRKFLEKNDSFKVSVSCTTRKPREGEINGVHYHFLSSAQFEDKISKSAFLEYSGHFSSYYGTGRDEIEGILESGKNALLEIDVVGGLNVKKNMPSAVLVMVVPASINQLKERLKGRGTESDEKIEERLSRYQFELSLYSSYDYVLVNDEINEAVEELEKIVQVEIEKRLNNENKVKKLLEE